MRVMNLPKTWRTRSISERHKIKQSVKNFRWLNLLLRLALLAVAYGMFRTTPRIICFFEVCKNLSYLSLWVPRAIQLPILFMCRQLVVRKLFSFGWAAKGEWKCIFFQTALDTLFFSCWEFTRAHVPFWLHLISENIYSTCIRIFIIQLSLL